LVKQPEIKAVLDELRVEKKKLEKLRIAMADTEELMA